MPGLITFISLALLFTNDAFALRKQQFRNHVKHTSHTASKQHDKSHDHAHRTPLTVTPTMWHDFKPAPIPKGVETHYKAPADATSPAAVVAGLNLGSSVQVTSATSSIIGSGLFPAPWWPFQNWCWWPEVRRDWTTLTKRQKASYVAAELCLRQLSSQLANLAGVSLLDDYADVHIQGAYDTTPIHYTASFLPWHRLLLNKHSQDLRSCGYSGPIPYWDWARDADANNVANATVFGADAFGGDGPTTGAFVNAIVNMVDLGGIATVQPHTLTRHFVTNTLFASNYNSTVMNGISSFPDYFSFLLALERVPHDTVHSVLGGGGDLSTMASPSDPLFFLIHANVDRVWANWQKNNPTAVQYQGPTQPAPGSPWDASPSDPLNMYGLQWLTTKVSDVLNTQGGYLCYSYDK